MPACSITWKVSSAKIGRRYAAPKSAASPVRPSRRTRPSTPARPATVPSRPKAAASVIDWLVAWTAAARSRAPTKRRHQGRAADGDEDGEAGDEPVEVAGRRLRRLVGHVLGPVGRGEPAGEEEVGHVDGEDEQLLDEDRPGQHQDEAHGRTGPVDDGRGGGRPFVAIIHRRARRAPRRSTPARRRRGSGRRRRACAGLRGRLAIDGDAAVADQVLGLPAAVREAGRLDRLRQGNVIAPQGEGWHGDDTPFSVAGVPVPRREARLVVGRPAPGTLRWAALSGAGPLRQAPADPRPLQ